MELLNVMLSAINNIFIGKLFFVILTLVFYRLAFRREDIFDISVSLTRWIIICYSILGLLSYSLLLVFPQEGYNFLDRATGPYWWSYLIMSSGHVLVPMLLLNKRLGKNIFFLLSLGIIMNLGVLLERLVIITTSLHRDYLPDSLGTPGVEGVEGIILMIIGIFISLIVSGLIVGAIIVIASYIIHSIKKRKEVAI